jgi:hypothetical protein
MHSKTLNLLGYAFLTLFAAAIIVVLASVPDTGRAMPALTMTASSTPSDRAHLPLIRYDASPTPAPTPADPPFGAAATLSITPYTHILASTYNTGSFRLVNISRNDEQLTELRIDLTTGIFPDMVFDPFGAAGDRVAKDVTVDVRQGLGFDGHEYEGPHDGGYDVLILKFHSFDSGDEFWFSVDVDPTSIAGVGAPGPFDTGSVGGLELVGATITATFGDGSVLTNQVSRMTDPGNGGRTHSGAIAVLRPGLPGRPVVAVSGISGPAVVSSANQIVRVSGPVGRPFVLLVVEGGLFTEGVPNGGFDLEPFESNTAVDVREYSGVLGPGGTADVAITLSKSMPEGGINLIAAYLDNHYGVAGLVAEPLVLQLE